MRKNAIPTKKADKPYQGRIFPSYVPLPDWLPNETIFSLASRYHRLSGTPPAHYTSNRLFGDSKRGYQHDFPSGLQYLIDVTHGKVGNINTLISGHTILPFYLALKPHHLAIDAITSMSGPSLGSLKYQLGLLTGRFGAAHPLKICVQCANADVADHGVAYWRLDHQLPTVWLCPIHDTPLRFNTLKTAGVSRFNWLLPEPAEFESASYFAFEPTQGQYRSLKAIARISLRLLHLPGNQSIDIATLLNTYRSRLLQIKRLTQKGQFRLNLIGKEYFEFISTLTTVPFYQGLPQTEHESINQVGRLLRQPRSNPNPIRHVLLISCLFKSWKNFWCQYQQTLLNRSTITNLIQSNTEEHANVTKRQYFLDLLMHQNLSISQAAAQSGVDVYTGIGWAKSISKGFAKRPKILKGSKLVKLIRLIHAGKDKSEIAQACGISVQTVSRFLRANLDLADSWEATRFQNKREQERSTWRTAMDAGQDYGIKHIRMLEPATYAWLYRNDRAWLERANKKVPGLRIVNKSNVDWSKRDKELSKLIQTTAYELIESSAESKISITDLYKKLPDLRARLRGPDKLHECHKVLMAIFSK